MVYYDDKKIIYSAPSQHAYSRPILIPFLIKIFFPEILTLLEICYFPYARNTSDICHPLYLIIFC